MEFSKAPKPLSSADALRTGPKSIFQADFSKVAGNRAQASGHDVHGYWRLSERVTDLCKWTSFQKGRVKLPDSDNLLQPQRLICQRTIVYKQRFYVCKKTYLLGAYLSP